jgi:hypothetical protein
MLCSATNLALSGGQCRGAYTDGGAATLGRLINAPFRGATPEQAAEAADGTTAESLWLLLAFAAAKLYLLSPLSLTMPTPTGVFLPTFVGGAAFGSAYGTLLRRLLPAAFAHSLPGHFALTGAAAVACASTRTMSTAVGTRPCRPCTPPRTTATPASEPAAAAAVPCPSHMAIPVPHSSPCSPVVRRSPPPAPPPAAAAAPPPAAAAPLRRWQSCSSSAGSSPFRFRC